MLQAFPRGEALILEWRDWTRCGLFRTETSIPIPYSRDASGILSVEGLNHNRIIGSSKTERLA